MLLQLPSESRGTQFQYLVHSQGTPRTAILAKIFFAYFLSSRVRYEAFLNMLGVDPNSAII